MNIEAIMREIEATKNDSFIKDNPRMKLCYEVIEYLYEKLDEKTQVLYEIAYEDEWMYDPEYFADILQEKARRHIESNT
jgi:hypothetical protein